MRRFKDKGFTILEVMIALGIFSILMYTIALMMRAEIGLFNTENMQNQNEQKARTALNIVLDQVRLHGYVVLDSEGEFDQGFYSNDPELESDGQPKCILNLNPDSGESHANTEVFYYPDQDELLFRKIGSLNEYLVADNITALEVEEIDGTTRLARIRVVAGDPASDISFELVTWVRLY